MVDYELGAAHYVRTGEVLPPTVLEELRQVDAILLGAVGPAIGSTEVPNGPVGARPCCSRCALRSTSTSTCGRSTACRARSSPIRTSLSSAENTEGPYVGEGGLLRRGTPHEVATQGSVNTRFGVERCVRFAFELAASRPARSLTLVHKTNVLTFSGDLWQRAFNDVAAEYPSVSTAYNHVDAAGDIHVHRCGSLRRDRHRQSLRRHPHRPRWRGQRRHRPRRLGEPDPCPDRTVALRTGARRRARHRGQVARQSPRRDPLRGDDARPPRRRGPRPSVSPRRVLEVQNELAASRSNS